MPSTPFPARGDRGGTPAAHPGAWSPLVPSRRRAKPPRAPVPDEASAASEDPIVLLRRRWELASVLHFLRVSLGFLPALSIRGSRGAFRLFRAQFMGFGFSFVGCKCLSR